MKNEKKETTAAFLLRQLLRPVCVLTLLVVPVYNRKQRRWDWRTNTINPLFWAVVFVGFVGLGVATAIARAWRELTKADGHE